MSRSKERLPYIYFGVTDLEPGGWSDVQENYCFKEFGEDVVGAAQASLPARTRHPGRAARSVISGSVEYILGMWFHPLKNCVYTLAASPLYP